MKKFALLGAGRTAALHAKNIERWGELKAVCDAGRDATWSLRAGVNAYTLVDDLLANEPEVDMVVVCSQAGFHAEQIIKSLQAKKHVICESPLCLTPAAAWQIIETEKFCRRNLYLVKPLLFHPVLQQLKDAVSQVKLGKVYSVQLSVFLGSSDEPFSLHRRKRFPDGGTLYNPVAPFLDALLWLFGSMSDVKGFLTNTAHGSSSEYEDSGVLALQLKEGAVGTFNWSVQNSSGKDETTLTVLAEKGMIRIGGKFLDELLLVQPEAGFPVEKVAEQIDQDMLYKRMYLQLKKAVEEGNKHDFSVYHGLETVVTIDKIYKAVSA